MIALQQPAKLSIVIVRKSLVVPKLTDENYLFCRKDLKKLTDLEWDRLYSDGIYRALKDHNLEAATHYVKKIDRGSSAADDFFYAIARRYFHLGNLKQSFKIAKKIENGDLAALIFTDISNEYLILKEHKKALKVAYYNKHKNSRIKEQTIFDVAWIFFREKKYDESFDLANSILFNFDEADKLFGEISKTYLCLGEYDRAYGVAKRISRDHQLADECFEMLAEVFLSNKDLLRARKAEKRMIFNYRKKENLRGRIQFLENTLKHTILSSPRNYTITYARY